MAYVIGGSWGDHEPHMIDEIPCDQMYDVSMMDDFFIDDRDRIYGDCLCDDCLRLKDNEHSNR